MERQRRGEYPPLQPQPGNPRSLLAEINVGGYRFVQTQGRSLEETSQMAQRIIEATGTPHEGEERESPQPETEPVHPVIEHPSTGGVAHLSWEKFRTNGNRPR